MSFLSGSVEKASVSRTVDPDDDIDSTALMPTVPPFVADGFDPLPYRSATVAVIAAGDAAVAVVQDGFAAVNSLPKGALHVHSPSVVSSPSPSPFLTSLCRCVRRCLCVSLWCGAVGTFGKADVKYSPSGLLVVHVPSKEGVAPHEAAAFAMDFVAEFRPAA